MDKIEINILVDLQYFEVFTATGFLDKKDRIRLHTLTKKSVNLLISKFINKVPF